MNSSLAKKHSFFSLILFTLPNIIMMFFLSLYIIVDGIFIARFVGTTALSAVNMIYPLISLQMAIGIMVSSGGSAIIAKKLGEKKEHESRQNFSLIIAVITFVGIIIALLGNLFINQIIILLGANEIQFDLCRTYGRILLMFSPFFFLQTAFQAFFVTAGKPTIGLIVTVIAGFVNIILDYILIVIFQMGIAGAAIGTGIGYCIPAIIGLFYFGVLRTNTLHFTKPTFDLNVLYKACSNGTSEMISNLSNAVTTFLFNYAFMKYYGVDGVAAITIVLYFQFVFTSIYFGYSMGVAPIISFKYGSGDTLQLKKIFKFSIIFLSFSSIFAYTVSTSILDSILIIFTQKESNVFDIITNGFPIFSITFLFMSFNIFTSALFTAFSDGRISGIISFCRTFVFLVGAILLLPMFLSEKGIWLSVPIAEALGIIVSIFFLIVNKKKYKFL